MPLLAYVATFLEQLHFRKIYFFTISTSSVQLDFKSNYFGSRVTFFKQLFLKSCYFFGTAAFSDLPLLLSSSSTTGTSSTGHLTIENKQLFRAATFSKNKLVQNKVIYRRTTFLKQALLCSIKFLRIATFSTKLFFKRGTL